MSKETERVDEQWERVSNHLRAEIGEAAYQSWLKPMTVREVRDGRVRISVPTRFMRDWVAAHYVERLGAIWGDEDPDVHAVEVFVQPERSAAREKTETRAPAVKSEAGGNGYGGEIGAPLDPRFVFDQFVVGKPNEFAYAASRRVAEADTVPFNPLFLYGGVGLGKTHLMHAIAWHIRSRDPARNVVYLSAEKFMYCFIRALREHNTVDFKDQFRSVNVLMIDDVQFISGKDSTQEEFFHTFNALVDQGRQIVI